MSEPWLAIETSGRGGRVGLWAGGVLRQAALDPARRHCRDLAPTAGELLNAAGLTAKHLRGVLVSAGPGSFTGLRVGVMTAKALAFAAGCRLVAVPTFAVVAEQTPAEAETVDVIADALQGLVYAQRFKRGTGWEAADELRIEPGAAWAARLPAGGWVSGPGLEKHEGLVPAEVPRAPDRVPGLEALVRVGLRLPALDDAGVLALEPTYLRPSSAEEQANKTARGT